MLRQQIEQARHTGISAFVVDWYGETRPFSDRNFALMEEAADESHFQVALLYNEAEDDDGQATDEAIAALDKAYKAYIGPEAPHRAAYLTYNGHPVIFIFPKHGRVDWNRVAEHCRGWDVAPLLFYKDEPPRNMPRISRACMHGCSPDRRAGPLTEATGASSISTISTRT